MRLDSLTIRGIGRFTDTVTIPFRDLPSGLIAVVGGNGEGKTFTMEAPHACFFRTFPSRDKPVYDYATRADAFIETVIELEGRGLFRGRLSLDGPHRKAEATLTRIDPDGRAVILNDGKLTTYEQVIADLLPPLDSLLASVVAAQTKVGSFTERDRKGKRELFAELLGLKHYAEMADRCRRAVARIEEEIHARVARRDVLAPLANDDVAAAVDQRAQQLQVDSLTVEGRRIDLRRLITDAESTLVALQEAAAAYADAKGQRDALEAERLGAVAALHANERAEQQAYETAKTEILRAQAARDAAIGRLAADAADLRGVEKERRQVAEGRERTIADARERIANNWDVIGRAAQIRAAAKAVVAIEASITATRAQQQDLRIKVDEAVQRHRALDTQRVSLEGAVADLRRAERAAATLTTVPCGGAGDYAVCTFLTDAKAGADRIRTLAQAPAELDAVDTQIDAVTTEHGRLKADLTTHLQTERQLLEQLTAAKREAEALSRLESAEARIKDLTRIIADAEQAAVEALRAVDAREAERQDRLAAERLARDEEYLATDAAVAARLSETLDQLATERDTLGRTVDALAVRVAVAAEAMAATQHASAQAGAVATALRAHRDEWDATTTTLATVQAQVADLHARAEQFRQHRASLSALTEQIEMLRQEAIDWGVLLKAVCPDGLPTLEIDHAGPAVTAFANDLLQVCYGGRFTMELVTQLPKASKGKDGSVSKEVFECLVYDQERAGEARDLSDLSGGERVIVEEVLRSAIALLVNTRNQQPIRTCWRDETTGALDKANAARYMAMLRRVQQIGGFHQILCVTHSEDCKVLADAQIRCAGGTVTIAEPPYAVDPIVEQQAVA